MIKQDLRKKDEIINAVEKVKISAQEYSDVLKEFGYEYNENLNDVLKQYGNDVFDASVNKDKSLLMRIKAAIDKQSFKDKIIEKEGYNVNERISQAHAKHIEDLKKIRTYIPDYEIEKEYDIEFYVFEGSKVHKLLEKMIENYDTTVELLDIVKPNANLYQSRMLKDRNEFRPPMYRLPEGFEKLLYQDENPNMFVIKGGKPKIGFGDVNVHDANWVKKIETIKV